MSLKGRLPSTLELKVAELKVDEEASPFCGSCRTGLDDENPGVVSDSASADASFLSPGDGVFMVEVRLGGTGPIYIGALSELELPARLEDAVLGFGGREASPVLPPVPLPPPRCRALGSKSGGSVIVSVSTTHQLCPKIWNI
jgi:hypothetical protein